MSEYNANSIRLVRTHPAAVLPFYATAGAAGMDVSAVEQSWIPEGCTIAVDTGWKIAVPAGYEVQVRSRSGASLKGLVVANSPGTIDEDYRGPLKVLLRWQPPPGTSSNLSAYEIKVGDRIAQLVLAKVEKAPVREVESFNDTTARGEGGHGSTGR